MLLLRMMTGGGGGRYTGEGAVIRVDDASRKGPRKEGRRGETAGVRLRHRRSATRRDDDVRMDFDEEGLHARAAVLERPAPSSQLVPFRARDVFLPDSEIIHEIELRRDR